MEEPFFTRSRFLKADRICSVALCLLAVLTYLPAAVYSLSLDPVFLSGLVISHHRGVILGGTSLDPNIGFTTQALGGLSAYDWLHGVVPWWNPYTGVGLPLAGEMQTSSFFLPFVFLLHFSGGLVFLKICLQIIVGLATFALLRQLGLGGMAAFAGAALYEFNGPLAMFSHAPMMPIAFLPVLLVGIERAFAKAQERRQGGWVLLAVALAYSIYSGFPEVAFIDGLLAAVWVLYRFVTARPCARLGFALKIAIGFISGVLLALPIIIPFLQYLGTSAISHIDPPDSGLPKGVFVALLLPYIFGPIGAFGQADPTRQLDHLWGGGGGYLNLTALFLAVAGLFSGKRERGLRILLGLWVAVFLVRLMGALHVGSLLDLIPEMRVIAVVRYCLASCAMATAILAAYALDDWRKQQTSRTGPVLVGGVIAVALSAVGLWLGSSLIHELFRKLRHEHYGFWFCASVLWGFGFTAAIAAIYLRRAAPRNSVLIGALVALNAFSLFLVPTLAGWRNVKYDFGVVAFLREHLGLKRFYTLGPFSPNYGAYFGTASINHNAVPIPMDWVRYIDTTLDPNSVVRVPSLFIGYGPPGSLEDREKALRTHVAGFEATSVKYVLTAPGSNPFIETEALPEVRAPQRLQPLGFGESISGELPKELAYGGFLWRVAVEIGAYNDASTGQLQATICDKDVCTSGMRSLAEVPRRGDFEIPLSRPLRVEKGDLLRYTFTHFDKSETTCNMYALFFWLWPLQGRDIKPLSIPGDAQLRYAPVLRLTYGVTESVQKPVYRGKAADIFELPHPENYFSASGACSVRPDSRERVRTSCKLAATLTRHEFYYPGWHAFVNGREVPIRRTNQIFQTVDIPEGDSTVSFDYRPTGIGWAYAGALLGLVGIAAGFLGNRVS